MEFKSLRNIESSFRQIRLFGIVFLSLCAVVTVWSVWNSYCFAEKQREKIYVLDNGKSLMLALSQDLSQNRPAEAREHVRRFHELFFTLSPEKSAIEHNVKRALLLADKSVYHYYSDFAEKGYYNRIIAGNINQVLKDRKSTRLNSSHVSISYAVFCLKKKKKKKKKEKKKKKKKKRKKHLKLRRYTN